MIQFDFSACTARHWSFSLNHSDQKSFWLKLSIQPATQRLKKIQIRIQVTWGRRGQIRSELNWEKNYKRQHEFNPSIHTTVKEMQALDLQLLKDREGGTAAKDMLLLWEGWCGVIELTRFIRKGRCRQRRSSGCSQRKEERRGRHWSSQPSSRCRGGCCPSSGGAGIRRPRAPYRSLRQYPLLCCSAPTRNATLPPGSAATCSLAGAVTVWARGSVRTAAAEICAEREKDGEGTRNGWGMRGERLGGAIKRNGSGWNLWRTILIYATTALTWQGMRLLFWFVLTKNTRFLGE